MILLEAISLDLWSYFAQQAPVVAVLGLFCWFLYKLILKRDETIKEKDLLLQQDGKDTRFLYGEAIKAQNKTTEALNRNNEIQLQLMELMKDVKRDIKDDIESLRELIYQKQ